MRSLVGALAVFGVAAYTSSSAADAAASPMAQNTPPSPGPHGEQLVEQSSETRFQLDLAVPDAALASYLPAGWTSNAASTGAAKDANLRAVFIDRVTINAPDGKPVGSGTNRLVYLVAPVKDSTGAAVQMVAGGLTEDPADAPGPFENYLAARTHTMQRSTASADDGAIQDAQDWVFEAYTGEHLELHVTYARGAAPRGPTSETLFYSAKNSAFYQLSRQDQVLDILRNVTTTPTDRVTAFSFKAGGGSYGTLFDGTERVLSWDNILWITRSVFVLP